MAGGVQPGRVRGPVARTGCLTLISGTCDCGTGSTTALVAIVAQELGVQHRDIRVQEGDSSLGPVDAGSYSQRSVYIGGQAALLAARAMRRRLAEVAPHRPGQSRSFTREQIAGLVERSGSAELQVEVRYVPTAQPASSCVCVVRVKIDRRTGVVVVEEVAAVVDCGTVINHLTARGQVFGAVGQGVSSALLEEFQVGDDGSVPTTFREHGVIRAGDTPNVEVLFIDQIADSGPFGAKGVGETALPPVPAAVANAVAAAIGRRVMALPITSRAVWEAMTCD